MPYWNINDADWLLRSHVASLQPTECDAEDVAFVKQFVYLLGNSESGVYNVAIIVITCSSGVGFCGVT